ncbi:hypothetical protein quinque_004140 [Culex quinquefasciatus]
MARNSGRVLRVVGVVLTLMVVCVRCEMRKSWKVKSTTAAEVELPNPALVKQSRMEQEVEAADPGQNLVESRTEQVEQETSPASSSTTAASQSQTTTKSRLRSTYVANRTAALFNSLRESVKAAPFLEDHVPDIQIDDFSADDTEEDEFGGGERDEHDAKAKKSDEDPYAEGYDMIETILEEVKSIASGEKPAEKPEENTVEPAEKVKQYDFGPVLNMTIDEPNNIVNVKLNEKVLKDIFTGRGSGGGFGGGNKKMWKYAMPLFILPFLIQSAVVPFMLMTVKLFLFKSFLAGKLAILLLLLGAFKNFTQKKEKDVYIKDLPERRYEPYNEWPYPYHSEGGRPSWA